MSDVLQFDLSDGVATITLNRPEAMNAITLAMASDLVEAMRRVRDDEAIRVGVFTGNGRVFTAGFDLKERAARSEGGGTMPGGSSAGEFFSAAPVETFMNFDTGKPLIAAINGYCLAGGLELALACDLRIAAEGATFGVPEIVRGFFPGGGAPQRLMRAIPQAAAMELLLLGGTIDAQQALAWGLVSRVVPSEELMPTAQELASRIAAHAPLAVRAVRELAYASQDMDLPRALRFGGSLRWIIGQTEDALEGPRAFAEKRDPEFKGR